MSTLAEFTVPGDTFPLGSIFEEFPDVTVELERLVPTSNVIIPYFWVQGTTQAEEEEIEAAFRRHSDVKSIKLVDQFDSEYLLRVDWSPEYHGILKAIAETDVFITSGVGTGGQWTFEVRSDDRQGIAEFQQYCLDHNIPVQLTALHTLTSHTGGTEFNLTEPQRDALVLAYERGFFESPRRASLDEIAEELDITRQSLASRLRRGHQRMIGSTLIES